MRSDDPRAARVRRHDARAESPESKPGAGHARSRVTSHESGNANAKWGCWLAVSEGKWVRRHRLEEPKEGINQLPDYNGGQRERDRVPEDKREADGREEILLLLTQ
jgi:hypothetical protein